MATGRCELLADISAMRDVVCDRNMYRQMCFEVVAVNVV